MTGQGPALDTLGAAFGSAVDDLPRMADYELVVDGLSGLKSLDVAVLRHLRDRDVFFPMEDADPEETDATQTVNGLAGRLHLEATVVTLALGRLVGTGFGRSTAVLEGDLFTISDIGLLLYDALERLNGARDGDSTSRKAH